MQPSPVFTQWVTNDCDLLVGVETTVKCFLVRVPNKICSITCRKMFQYSVSKILTCFIIFNGLPGHLFPFQYMKKRVKTQGFLNRITKIYLGNYYLRTHQLWSNLPVMPLSKILLSIHNVYASIPILCW